MEFHREMKERDLGENGSSPSDARSAARRALGNVALARDRARDVWLWPWLDGLIFDVRLTLRGLRRDRAFALAAIAILAIAIGMNTTVFTIMNAMLFRGFPHVQRNDRLVYLQERSAAGQCCISYADFKDWRAEAHAFDGLAFVGERNISLRGRDGRPLDTLAFTISTNTFRLLGVPPVLGRDFAADDEAPGAASVAILNHRFWESRFNKRPDVVGSTVTINGAPTTIVGVMPQGFDFPTRENVWMPLVPNAQLEQRGLTPGGFVVVARLNDGATQQQARVELEAINRRLESDYPLTNRGLTPSLATHSESMSGRDARLIWGSLWVAAWCVLLVACASLANLSMVRTIGRWREFSTRIALGAGQMRMVRQILLESVILAGIAAVFGWQIATWSIQRWIAVTDSRYQILDYAIDSTTFTYLVSIAGGAALLCSLAPIARVIQLGVSNALKGDARGVTEGLRGRRLAVGLIAGQMALALVLLSSAGVLVRSFTHIVGAESGVPNPDHILVGLLQLPSETYPIPETRRSYFDRLEGRLQTIPGLEERALASTIPVKSAPLRTIELEGRTPQDQDAAVGFVRASADYFRVLGTSVVAGRSFSDGDHASSAPVAIVNERFAAMFWPHEQALGKRLRPRNRRDWLTVVGVVPNIQQNDPLRQEFRPLVYIPFQQEPATRQMYFLARTQSPDRVASALRNEVQTLDPDVVLEDFGTLKASFAFQRDFMDPEHSELGKYSKVAPVFAVIALLLSAAGLYAVIAHAVSQRTKEIGVRMAVGAASHNIRRLILFEGMRPVALGLLLGVAISFGVNRMLQSQLVGVSPYDPVTFVIAAVTLILAALLACHLPSRRAVRINPVVALQHE